MPFTDEDRRKGGEASQTHGIHAMENRGAASLTDIEVATLRELKELVRTESGKAEVKREITARLVLIARKMFSDMEEKLGDPRWWEAGVVRRGATYLAELRRWMDSLPPEENELRNVTDLLRSEGVEHLEGAPVAPAQRGDSE
jgi:hypothetical protein